tara:strand:- start:1918 stop:4050 length:2133 start_codon:yes stop_codon:yes gene_type:complete
MKKFPDNLIELFAMLADDNQAKRLFNIKSSKVGKKSITNPVFDSMVNHFRANEISQDSVRQYLRDNDILTTLIPNSLGKAERLQLRSNMANNLETLIQNLGKRQSRDQTQRLLDAILADNDKSKAGIVALNVFIKDASYPKLKTIQDRYLSSEIRLKLIEIVEKYTSKKKNFTPSDFDKDTMINLNNNLITIRSVAQDIDAKELNDEAKKNGWTVESSGNTVILRKIFKMGVKTTEESLKKLIKDDLPSVDSANDGQNTQIAQKPSDLRRLLYGKEATFKTIGGFSQIAAKTQVILEDFGTVDKEIIESWFKLVTEGVGTGLSSDAEFMKAITNFKVNGSSMYGKFLSGKTQTKNHKTSFYVRELLEQPLSQNLFDEVMKNIKGSLRVSRQNWIAWKKASLDTKKEKDAFEIDARKPLTDESRQAFEEAYIKATTNSIQAIMLEYLMKDEGLKISNDDYYILNVNEKRESQIALIEDSEVMKKVSDLRTKILEDPNALIFYKDWLEENDYAEDLTLFRERRMASQLPKKKTEEETEEEIEEIDFTYLDTESELVRVIYSVIHNAPTKVTEDKDGEKVERPIDGIFRKYLGNRSKLAKYVKSNKKDIKEGLVVFYHICNTMGSSLVTEAQAIDKHTSKGLSAENESLLAAVKKFAAKMERSLKLFKNRFKEELGTRLKDIADNPKKYPAVYDKRPYINKLIKYSLLKRRPQ